MAWAMIDTQQSTPDKTEKLLIYYQSLNVLEIVPTTFTAKCVVTIFPVLFISYDEYYWYMREKMLDSFNVLALFLISIALSLVYTSMFFEGSWAS